MRYWTLIQRIFDIFPLKFLRTQHFCSVSSSIVPLENSICCAGVYMKVFVIFDPFCQSKFVQTPSLYVCIVLRGDQQTLEPWKTLKNPGFSLPLEKYPGKPWNYNIPPEELCTEADFPRVNFWTCSTVGFFIPVTQWARINEAIEGKNSVSFVVWQAATFSNNRHKISSKKVDGYRQKIYMW